MTAVEIYALCEADTGEVRYIGKANNAQRRFSSHMRDARRRNTPVYCWLRKRVAEGRIPIVRVLVTCAAEDWQAIEVKAIADAKQEGARLLNVALGGDEPHCSPEVRASNARRVTELRPKNVMRAYRMMESSARHLEKMGRPDAREKLAAFKMAVDRCRAVGKLAELDAMLGETLGKRRQPA